MNWKHYIGVLVVVLVGFWIGKNYGGLFANVPGVNKVL